MKAQYSTAELASLSLKELPGSERGIRMKVERENWAYTEVAALGGKGGKRKEYTPPADILAAIRAKQATKLLNSTVSTLPVLQNQLPAVQDQHLNTSQSQVEGARKGVLTAIERLVETTGCTKMSAMQTLLTQAMLPEFAQIRQLFDLATDSRGKTGALPTTRTIKRWFVQAEQNALAPKVKAADMTVPAWAKDFLGWWQQPEKPSVQSAYDDFVKGYKGNPPSVYAVRRFIAKLGNVTREHGRMGNRELRNIQVFVRRTFDTLQPTDIYTADGHTFDAEVQHPLHSKPWRPEITTVADVATRKIVGWSVDLAESALAVLSAISDAAMKNGIPAIFYVDNGSGYKNKLMSDSATGLMGRLGTEMIHSIPYNSQARGVIERLHKSVWVKAAKELPTYIGADMDKEAKHLAFKLTRKALKGQSQRIVAMQFSDFIVFCKEKVEAYNNRPHRSLPKIVDTTGARRHMTPSECWDIKVAQGAEVHTVSNDEAIYLFKPQIRRKIFRGEINFIGNRYFSRALEEFHDETLTIAYDIHDAERIWVYDDKSRLICTAEWNGNATHYLPMSYVQSKRDKRAAGRERLLNVRLDEVRAEHRGRPVIEHQDSVTIAGTTLNTFDIADLKRQREAALSSIKAKQNIDYAQDAVVIEADYEEKPLQQPTTRFNAPELPKARFELFQQLTEKLIQGGDVSEHEKKWLGMYQRSNEYQALSKRIVNM